VLSWQGPSQAKVGDTISVTINTQSSQRVNNLGFHVGFDPAVLKAVDVLEGNFLKQGNSPSIFTKNVDQAGGQITLNVAGSGTVGTSGAGSVATLVFEVLAARPQSQINATQITSLGAGGEAIAFTAPEPHSMEVAQ
jgi:general secretion pathway protein D